MSGISFKVDPADLDEITKSLNGLNYKSPTVLKNAANATGKRALKTLYEYINREYAYNGKESIQSHVTRKSATYANPRMIINVRSRMNELIDFDVSHDYPLVWTDPSSWVQGRVRTSSGRKPVKNSAGNKAFVAQFKSGHSSVVARVGKGRKIRTISSPSFSHMAARAWEENEDMVNSLLRSSVERQIEKVMAHING